MNNKNFSKCYKCGKVKEVKLFHNYGKTFDGRNPFCISCIQSQAANDFADAELRKFKSNKNKKTEAA